MTQELSREQKENAARIAELYMALLLIAMAVLIIFPLCCLVWLAIKGYKDLRAYLRSRKKDYYAVVNYADDDKEENVPDKIFSPAMIGGTIKQKIAQAQKMLGIRTEVAGLVVQEEKTIELELGTIALPTEEFAITETLTEEPTESTKSETSLIMAEDAVVMHDQDD